MKEQNKEKKAHKPTYTATGKDHHQYKHGMSSIKNRNPLYQKWAGMKRRCLNKNEKSYPSYGGRGITISKEWLEFENFRNDMEQSFQKGLSLERIDNDKGYSKDNCKWIPMKEQARNKRNVTLYLYKGERFSIPELEAKYGFNAETLRNRIKNLKWSIEKAIETPVSYGNKYRNHKKED